MKAVVAAIGLVAAAALGALQWHNAYAAEEAAPNAALVIVVHATNACFSDSVRVTGFLVPRKVAVVVVNSEGNKVTDVLAFEGDQVISGQNLARLYRPASKDPRAPGGTVPAKETTLHAPAAGLVMSSAAQVGAIVSPQTGPLFKIIVDNVIELQADVPALQVPKLKPGAPARISVDDGQPERNGRVRLVEAEIDPHTQLGHARVAIDKDPTLRVGMFARTTIDASRSCGISVPQSAIIYQTRGTSVQIVRNNVIQTRKVKLGLLSDNNVEIREGLSDGDTVVANAGASLHDGDRVKTILADENDQPRVK